MGRGVKVLLINILGNIVAMVAVLLGVIAIGCVGGALEGEHILRGLAFAGLFGCLSAVVAKVAIALMMV